jgi:glycyl-tRNA synthetase (class II)
LAFKNQRTHRVYYCQEYEIEKENVTIKVGTKKVSGENVVPHVIEPSFGVGRVLTAVLEHAFWIREDHEQKSVLSIPSSIAPVKVGLFPLLTKPDFNEKIAEIEASTEIVLDMGAEQITVTPADFEITSEDMQVGW